MSTLKTGALRGTSGTADSIQLHASNQSVTFPGATTFTGAMEIPNDTVDIADLSASGTASSSTFLRGDNAWAAAGGGKVVQYVWTTDNTNITCASNTNVELMDATITPTSASNKILVQCLTRVYSDASAYAFYGGYIKRGDASGTTIATYSGGFVSSDDIEAMVPIWWLDEPNTTSATEYTLILSRWSSSTTSVTTNSYANSILLWELEG